ncbi:hypothetical protein [Spirosoma montaniterrae]|uniref:Uncharacterized protein n=1 Tax=Spirosoma montaniterrae TaxID=1178516 RepID=A0A1P9WU09_9BACT|nr:hypothetical protein [Spirosoma montaniterrae]AQG78875.1 hypothetical protein AWR27_05775 [Spirosoma montaniterrae]
MRQSEAASLREAFSFFTNYEGHPNQDVSYADKMKNLATGPNRLYDFFAFLRYFVRRSRKELAITDCEHLPKVLTLTVSKGNVLQTLAYFDNAKCLNIKICFGMDECLIPQLVVSGSFCCDDQGPSVDLVDQPYRKQTEDGQAGHYVLNFGDEISVDEARTLLNRFEEIVTRDLSDPVDLRGYALDIKTFRHLLSDDVYLGQAEEIRIRMGMNNDGFDDSIPNSGSVRIMMLEFSDVNEDVGTPFYMCSGRVKDDSDPTECPPRQPCNATIS